jgi:hypothetical protein
MSYHVTNDLFPHRTSHAIIGSSSIEGSGLVLAGSGVALAGSGVALAGAGFGKGTRKKVLKTVGKVARAGLGLAKAFGTPEQQAKAQQAETAYGIVKGAGCAMPKPAAKLRKMMT